MYLARYDTPVGQIVQGAVLLDLPSADQSALRLELAQMLLPQLQQLWQRRNCVTVLIRPLGSRDRSMTVLIAMPASEEATLRSCLLRIHQLGQHLPVTCDAIARREDFDAVMARMGGAAIEITAASVVRDSVQFFPAYQCIERLSELHAQIGRGGDEALMCWCLSSTDPKPWEKGLRMNLVRMSRHWIPQRVRLQHERMTACYLEHGLLADQFLIAPDPTARQRLHSIVRSELAATDGYAEFTDDGTNDIDDFSAEALGIERLSSAASEPLLGKAIVPEQFARQLLELLALDRPTAQSSAPGKPARVFVSYAHEDEEFARQLAVSCAQLRRDGWVELWSDAEILPGTPWRDEIQDALESADIIILLISPAFTHSDFCTGIEMRRALDRQAAGTAEVIPVRVRWTDTTNAPFEHLQQLPTARRPIASWPDRDAAWLDVVSGLRRVLGRQTSSKRPAQLRRSS